MMRLGLAISVRGIGVSARSAKNIARGLVQCVQGPRHRSQSKPHQVRIVSGISVFRVASLAPGPTKIRACNLPDRRLAGLQYFTPTFVPYCMIPITYMHVYSISYVDSRRLQLHGGVAIILTHLKQAMVCTTTARRAVRQRSCHLWLRSRYFASRYAA